MSNEKHSGEEQMKNLIRQCSLTVHVDKDADGTKIVYSVLAHDKNGAEFLNSEDGQALLNRISDESKGILVRVKDMVSDNWVWFTVGAVVLAAGGYAAYTMYERRKASSAEEPEAEELAA